MGFVCSFSDRQDYVMKFEGREVRFDWSDMFGPLFLTKDGEPLKRQPTNGAIIEAAQRHRNAHMANFAPGCACKDIVVPIKRLGPQKDRNQ